MSKQWTMVRLADVIKQRKEFIRIDDMQNYKRCRVQLHAQGIVLRDTVPGSEIKTKDQQVCHAGEFLVAEIDAKVGGFGIVPVELDGAIVSSHYFLFIVDESKLDRGFLEYFIQTSTFRDQVTAQGSTNYAAIHPSDVLSYTVPLPPLDEQRRIVARIDELAGKIERAKELWRNTTEMIDVLFVNALAVKRVALLQTFPVCELGSLTTVTSGGTPLRDVQTYWNGDIPWVKTGELVDGTILDTEEKITHDGLINSSAKIFPVGTVLIALYGQGQTRGRTGLLALKASTNQACCAILPVLDRLNPRFLQYWLRSLYRIMREQSHGGAQPNWNSRMIKEVEIALLPLKDQQHVIEYFDYLQSRVDAVKRLQAEITTELDALLPAVLDKAFKGEL